MSVHC